MPVLRTDRLDLIPATLELLTADLTGSDTLSQLLKATVPVDWPPPLYDHDAVRFAIERIREGAMDDDWCFYYIVLRGDSNRRTAIGAGGFKGRPTDAGEIEVGYALLPKFQRQGFATEALKAWAEYSLSDPNVSVLVANTLPGLDASIHVAESAGFRYAGRGEDGHAPEGAEVLRYELRR
jgi:ribosomal-protein-alanine N-acetyltransferase